MTAAFVVGMTSTTFAAANPFSDIPAGHWALRSVEKLAAAGVVEGYGDYDDASEKGQWNIYAGYRKYGTNVSFLPTEDDTLRGTRGFVVGAAWAPFKNIGLLVKYFNGKYITAAPNGGHGKADKFFGRVEFFF